MIRNIFPLMLLFILVNPITRISDGETFFQDNSETLLTLSSQSSKILADFQGEDKMDTQRDESSPRDLIRKELDSNRINNLKINVLKPLSEIEKKALLLPKSSRAFLMSPDIRPDIRDVSNVSVVATLFVHPVKDPDIRDVSSKNLFKLCRLCYTPKTVGESGIAQVELEKALDISHESYPNSGHESYPNSGHLKVDRVIELPSLPAIAEWELIPIEWELREWRTR